MEGTSRMFDTATFASFSLALIPYIPQPVWETPWFRIQLWDVLVATGVLTGAWIASRCARSIGRDPAVIFDLAPWVVLAGFAMAHWVHVFFYEPSLLEQDPWNLIYIWSGLSSYGGFLGAAIALPLFFRSRKLRFWEYADSLAVGMAVAWGIARVGCFFAHDHIGKPSEFFLAVDFPNGARHDLGLYDAILSFALAGVCWTLFRRRSRVGLTTSVLFIGYAAVRFGLDFLRSVDLAQSDLRYAGLTPAQYGSIVLAGLGVYGVIRSRRAPRLDALPPEGSAPAAV